jgi:hypothetical protein
MKKGSTAAAKQSRNISQQNLTIGLDLGDRNSWYGLRDHWPARPTLTPQIQFLYIGSRICSTLPSDPALR